MGSSAVGIAGLIAAAVGTGTTLFAQNRAKKQAASDTQAVMRQQMLEQSDLAKQTATYQSQQQQAQQAMKNSADAFIKQKQALLSQPLSPLQDIGSKGMQTIVTSPLGDLSEPTLGRKRLLGN